MDPRNKNIPKGNVGFFDFVVQPMIETWCDFSKDKFLMECLLTNRQYWQRLMEWGMKDVEMPAFEVKNVLDLFYFIESWL